jgi:hypothetical protein
MDKYQALFVRAIKSKSPDFRVKRLYSRFYCSQVAEIHICRVVSKIVEHNNLMSTKDWIDGLNPINGWMYGIDENTSYYERCNKLMYSFIRLTEISKFDKFPLPAFWRNK